MKCSDCNKELTPEDIKKQIKTYMIGVGMIGILLFVIAGVIWLSFRIFK